MRSTTRTRFPAVVFATLAAATVAPTLDAQDTPAPTKASPDQTSKQPPRSPSGGPAWTKDFFEARDRALATGKPIFLYSTKTY